MWHPVTLLLLGIGSVLLAMTGPFGTYSSSGFLWRLLFWTVTVYASTFISLSVKSIVRHVQGPAPVWASETASVVLMTIAFTPFISVLMHLMFSMPLSMSSLWYVGFYVFCITAMISVIRQVILTVVPSSARTGSEPSTRLLRRLPEDFEGPILRVSVNDHFVEVVGPCAVETLRMRFSDAVSELEGLDGAVTHRSHWVAKQAVVETVQDKGKTMLVLENGDQVPVSRTYRPRLSDIGLL